MTFLTVILIVLLSFSAGSGFTYLMYSHIKTEIARIRQDWATFDNRISLQFSALKSQNNTILANTAPTNADANSTTPLTPLG